MHPNLQVAVHHLRVHPGAAGFQKRILDSHFSSSGALLGRTVSAICAASVRPCRSSGGHQRCSGLDAATGGLSTLAAVNQPEPPMLKLIPLAALGADLTLPTGTQEELGAEKRQLGPSVTVAFFLPHNLIFAPASKHNFSFAGDDVSADIHQGVLDFYLVWKFDRSRQWFTLDPKFLLDYENDRYDAAGVP